jgi:hypothetical protein
LLREFPPSTVSLFHEKATSATKQNSDAARLPHLVS